MFFEEDEILAEELQHILNMDGANDDQNIGEYDDFEFNDIEESSPELLPNVHELFDVFNKLYFWDALGTVEVKWSPKMRSSCGRCYYRRGRSCCIKLSVPLLAERSLKDVVNTLLHEMIHAYLFVTGNEDNTEDHGPEFLQHMVRINEEAGTSIAIYDNFEPGPSHRQKHIWRCNGPCRNTRPTFGFIKKRGNKVPGPNDYWWEDHQSQCGGSFTKILEPRYECSQTVRQREDETEEARGPRDNGGTIPRESSGEQSSMSFEDDLPNAQNENDTQDLNDLPGCSGTQTQNPLTQPEPDDDEFEDDEVEVMLDDEKIKNEYLRVEETVKNAWTSQNTSPEKTKPKTNTMRMTSPSPTEKKERQMECPVCRRSFGENEINEHIDECLIEEACTVAADEEADRLNSEQSSAEEPVKSKEEVCCTKRLNSNLAPCPICASLVHPDLLKGHVTNCLFYGFGNENSTEEEMEDDDDDMDRDRVLCPCCFRWVQQRTLEDHMNECLAYIHRDNSKSD